MENYQHSELQHGSERLFYTRKAISLTSQQRLRRTCVLRWNYTNIKLAYALQNGLGAEL